MAERSSSTAPTSKVEPRDRKAEHIRLALEPSMQVGTIGFDAYRFEHRAFPETDLEDVDTSCEFLGRRLRAPLLISCMTGGTEDAMRINRHLALAAERAGVAVGVGSQRKAIEDPRKAASFRIRTYAPSVPVLANLGAVQLNYGFGLDECRAAIEMIDADALVMHLNPLQEAIQPEGQTRFSGLLDRVGEMAAQLDVPVIVKEVGSGLSAADARALASRGIRYVDTAGQGGTSWARIEAARADAPTLGDVFGAWGIPTPDSIVGVSGVRGLTVIGSGGVRNGVDAAKALALGAHMVGMAYPFLKAATESAERVEETLAATRRELAISMFCCGASDLAELHRTPLVRIGVPPSHGGAER